MLSHEAWYECIEHKARGLTSRKLALDMTLAAAHSHLMSVAGRVPSTIALAATYADSLG